jgi:putative tryptophan/tyrosine transport system substrate-binding protein
MRRREFVTLIGGMAAAWPLAAKGQQGDRVRLVAVASSFVADDPVVQVRIASFARALHERGWVEGRNIRIDYRSVPFALDGVQALAAELVALAPDLIVATSTTIVRELQRRTSRIPIVFVAIGDPVESGIVSSLARPGGNTTGYMNYEPVIAGKWLELLKEVAPSTNRVLLLSSGSAAAANIVRMFEATAPALGVRLTAATILDRNAIGQAIAAIAAESNRGLVVTPALVGERDLIIALASRYRLPAVYPYRFFAVEGGLMSFGPDTAATWVSAASYVDRILRGEKPGELPVQGPVKFELVVNLKTAKAIGLDIPSTLLARADEVIE